MTRSEGHCKLCMGLMEDKSSTSIVSTISLDTRISRTGLLLANTHARQLGLRAKIESVQADAHAIPLAGHCVDRITCRCGIMFFNDTGLVMSEVLRVLKPGGRIAFLVWGSFEQPFFDATVGVVLRLVSGAQIDKHRLGLQGTRSSAEKQNVRRGIQRSLLGRGFGRPTEWIDVTQARSSFVCLRSKKSPYCSARLERPKRKIRRLGARMCCG